MRHDSFRGSLFPCYTPFRTYPTVIQYRPRPRTITSPPIKLLQYVLYGSTSVTYSFMSELPSPETLLPNASPMYGTYSVQEAQKAQRHRGTEALCNVRTAIATALRRKYCSTSRESQLPYRPCAEREKEDKNYF